jgi:glycerate kinase
MDEETFEGKAVGGVKDMAAELNIPVVAICGDIHESARSRMEAVSLVDLFGEQRAFAQPIHCIELAAMQILTRFAI